MLLIDRFKEHLKNSNLFSPKDKLLLAVSGGVDSVVLCELCKQAGYTFSIAHCNFKLRDQESERDKEFVCGLAKKYSVDFYLKEFDTEKFAKENKLSIQEAARKLRYDWFAELIVTHDSQLTTLLTAHHADDNIETVLMNLFRGTGLHGLTGIPPSINYIKRPLLAFSKEELIQFAKENNLEFVEDSSNLSNKYTRNFFRHEIIPLITNAYPQVQENLQNNIDRFKEIEKLYRISVAEIKKKLCKVKRNEVHIPVKQLMGYNNKALIYEIISEYGFSEKQIEEVIRLAESDSGRYINSPDNVYRIIKHRHWFIISPASSGEVENFIIEKEDSPIKFPLGILKLETTSNIEPQTSNMVATLDAKEIEFPLLLRKWKQGDYFYPLGMKKKKKLARFFIDQKLSKTQKENAWVIEMNKKIIWVVGNRIDERFKIADKTRSVLKISLISGQIE